eukprot:6122708-Alexandrium_andersonii.AAC.1
MLLAHKWRSRAAQFLDTAQCPCCLVEFWSRDRALKHLNDSAPRCAEWVAANLPPLLPEQREAAETEE